MKYRFIVPTISQSQITGLTLCAIKDIGKSQWKLDFYQSTNELRIFKDHQLVTEFNNLPKSVTRFVADFSKFTNAYNGGITN